MNNSLPKAGDQSIQTPPVSPPTSVPNSAVPSPPLKPTGSLFKEAGPRTVEKTDFEPPVEVKAWVEKVEEGDEITLPHPIKDEYGEILMESAAPPHPTIVLPMSKKNLKKAVHKRIAESVRWLAEWCLRVIKMFPARIDYKKEEVPVEIKQ